MLQFILLSTVYYMMVNHLKTRNIGNKLTIHIAITVFAGKSAFKEEGDKADLPIHYKKNYSISINLTKKLDVSHLSAGFHVKQMLL